MTRREGQNEAPSRARRGKLNLPAVFAATGLLAILGSVVAASAFSQQSASRPTATQAASQPAGPAGPSFVLRAKAIYTASPGRPGALDGGLIVVRDGRITAVGNEITAPADLPLIDLKDEIVCPGFVGAGGAIIGQHAGPQSLGAGFDALDAFDIYGDFAPQLASGITTAHLSPGGHRLVTGRGAIAKLAGDPARRVLKPAADLSINFGVYDPPRLIKPPFYASSDVGITPAKRQGPESRLGQVFEIEQLITASKIADSPRDASFDFHGAAFARIWATDIPIRIQARRAADIEDALQFAGRYKRKAYIVGAVEGDQLSEPLALAGLPIVLRLEHRYRGPDFPLGPDPEALDAQIRVAGQLGKLAARNRNLKVALAGAEGDSQADLRMVAALAMRGGMTHDQALAAITRVPAEILGVENRVGSIAPGLDADFLVLSGRPLDVDSQVLKAYVGGRVVFDAVAAASIAGAKRPVVVKGGTVWVGNGTVIQNGAVLLEDGKIRAVGQRVPRPPLARVVDAGADAFIVPGFIDAHGHLGLEEVGQPESTRTVAGPEVSLAAAIGTAGSEFVRVARAGVTTVMLAAYRTGANGSRVAAIKTFGRTRDEMMARETAGVKFTLTGADPLLGPNGIRDTLEAGKKYEESWKKYHDELEKWKKEKESGATSKPSGETETKVEGEKPDPITGTWEFTLSGGPIPEPVKATMKLRLTGNQIEGRATSPRSDEEVRLTGTLDGDQVTLELDQDTGMGHPTIKGRLDREDHMAGQFKLGDLFSLDFEATRTDKAAVEFKVERSKKRGKDGRPQPPAVDEKLEPLRPLLAGKIPAVVEVRSTAETRAALRLFVDQYKIPVVLLDSPDAASIAQELTSRKDNVGVVPPAEIVRRADVRDPAMRTPGGARVGTSPQSTSYNQAADLARLGVRVALQSDAEDGARALPLMGLFAVQQGMGGDEALRALTVDAAKMYRMDDRLGTLEVGKDADVLIFSGHPFDAGSRLEHVFVGGREVRDE
jgi:imidazolonepropionase-like amidohydrolase